MVRGAEGKKIEGNKRTKNDHNQPGGKQPLSETKEQGKDKKAGFHLKKR